MKIDDCCVEDIQNPAYKFDQIIIKRRLYFPALAGEKFSLLFCFLDFYFLVFYAFTTLIGMVTSPRSGLEILTVADPSAPVVLI